MNLKTLLIIAISATLCNGCAVVPTDFMPKFTWYWSKDAKEWRREKKASKQYQIDHKKP